MPARPGAGTPRGTGPPLRAPSGRGRSPTQARGQAGTCQAGPGLAERGPRAAGWGRASRLWGPRGRRRGWSGLAIRGPGRALGPGRYPGSRFLAPGPGIKLAPPLPVPLYGRRGVILRGPPRPQSCRWTPACCPGDQTRSPVSPPPLGQWNHPRTRSSLFVSGRRGLNQCWGGGTVMEVRAAGRVPSIPASARVARPGSSSSSKNRRDPGRGARSRRNRVTEAGPGSFPGGCCHTSCRGALSPACF